MEDSPKKLICPFRIRLKSADKLSYISMNVEWTDAKGERQKWFSWKDEICGVHESVKLLPSSSTDIRITFRSHPVKHVVRKVDRRNKSKWQKGEEVIEIPGGHVDAFFLMKGPMMRCYVWRAKNLRNKGDLADWEHFPDAPDPAPPPTVLVAADQAMELHDELTPVERVSVCMARLRAAAQALMDVRQRTRTLLQQLEFQLQRQWLGVNTTNTASAGLAVASFATLFIAPPVGLALGVSSAAVGVGAIGADYAADVIRSGAFRGTVLDDMYEQLAFEQIEGELHIALTCALTSVQQSNTGRKMLMAGLVMKAMGHGLLATRIGEMGMNFGRFGVMASMAGKFLGGVGAGLAVGAAVYGWSTKKPNQKMVAEKLDEVERSIGYLAGLMRQVDGVLQCKLCGEDMDFYQPTRRCEKFHCFHKGCLTSDDMDCPLCAHGSLLPVDDSWDRLRLLLNIHGATGIESLEPETIDQARDLYGKLEQHPERIRARTMTPDLVLQAYNLPEDAEMHEIWNDKIHQVGGRIEDVSVVDAEKLIVQFGMPIKHRHELWPRWLYVERSGTFKMWSECSLPEETMETIDHDIPRTSGTEALKSLKTVLVAAAACNPSAGYAQGMNQIVAVLLRLGFEDETAFWIFEGIVQLILPQCHAQDLRGLFRDTAVMDVLLKTFLPELAEVFEDFGVELIWITTDFFLTLGSHYASLSMVARLWDLTFLHGPRAFFCGLLAMLCLYFPRDVPEADAQGLMLLFRQRIKDGDAEEFGVTILSFLHECEGGLTNELIDALRLELGAGGVTHRPRPSDEGSTSTTMSLTGLDSGYAGGSPLASSEASPGASPMYRSRTSGELQFFDNR